MTSKWFGSIRGPESRRRLGVSVLVPLSALALCASSVPSSPLAPETRSAPEASASPTPPQPIQPHRIAFAPGENVEALAAAVARKYRVSEEATRGLVAAAYREGVRNGLDPLLVIAVIAVESRFNPIAQSDGGAVGLMQVIPHYHADKFDASERASVLEPHMNIHVGARILKEYIARAGNEVAGLQLYNGSSADATNAYANRVLGEKQWLRDAIRRSAQRARA